MSFRKAFRDFAKEHVLPGLNRERKTGLLPTVAAGNHIPRIIHQTYPTADVPELIAENIAKLKAMNPGWEYRLYTDVDVAEFIKREYGEEILRYFERINPRYGAARADLFRYLLIYKLGGFYLDIKGSLTKPLDGVIAADDVFLLTQWGFTPEEEGYGVATMHEELVAIPGGEYVQWQIAAAPGHPFLKAVIENVLANIDIYNPTVHGVGKYAVLNLTGPIAYTLTIQPLRQSHPHRFVEAVKDAGFVYTIFKKEIWRAHKGLFKLHYSQVQEPLILGSENNLLAMALVLPKKVFQLVNARQ